MGNSEMQDAQWQKKHAQNELQKQQRQRCEDVQKFKSLTADRQSIKAEAEHLRARLQWAENALMRREDDSTPSHRGGARSSRCATPKNRQSSCEAPENSASSGRCKEPMEFGFDSRVSNCPEAAGERGHAATPELAPSVTEDSMVIPNKPRRSADLDARRYDVSEEDKLIRAPLTQQSMTYTSSDAGAKLFEMLDKAKERADQRRLLSGAAQEVRAKARALEVLLLEDGTSVA